MKNAAIALVLGVASVTGAETWPFSLATSGEDVFWMSPTGVEPGAFGYDTGYTLTNVTATVSIFGAPVDVDVTAEIPPELLSGVSMSDGPAPVILVDQFVVSPPPPEPASIAADLRFELDAAGFANASATNVVFGTVTQNVPPFGDITVPLVGISFTGTLTVNAVLTRPEDLNGDGVVDAGDLAQLLAAWGACTAMGACPADLNADGFVDAGDLATLLAAWGVGAGASRTTALLWGE